MSAVLEFYYITAVGTLVMKMLASKRNFLLPVCKLLCPCGYSWKELVMGMDLAK